MPAPASSVHALEARLALTALGRLAGDRAAPPLSDGFDAVTLRALLAESWTRLVTAAMAASAAFADRPLIALGGERPWRTMALSGVFRIAVAPGLAQVQFLDPRNEPVPPSSNLDRLLLAAYLPTGRSPIHRAHRLCQLLELAADWVQAQAALTRAAARATSDTTRV